MRGWLSAIGVKIFISRRSPSISALSAQTTAFLLLFVQQVALVPVFISHWGVDAYAEWLVIFFVANLGRLLDLGLNFYLGNELRHAVASGAVENQNRIVRAGTAAYILLLVVAGLMGLTVFWLVNPMSLFSLTAISKTSAELSFSALALSSLAATYRDFLFNLYPAHNEMARGVLLFNGQLILRLLFVGSALIVFDADALVVSIVWAATDLVVGTMAVVVDVRKRYRLGTLAPRHGDMAVPRLHHLAALAKYGMAYTADQILISAPVVILGALAVPHQEVVIFNVARTYSNVARQFLTQYGRTLGIEVAQLAMRDEKRARESYAVGLTFLGCVAGGLIGGLATAAPTIYNVWVREPGVFQYSVLLTMLATFVVAGPGQVPLSVLRYSRRQGLVSLALAVQAIGSVGGGIAGGAAFGAVGLAAVLMVMETSAVGGLAAAAAGRFLGTGYRVFLLRGVATSLAVLVSSSVATYLALSIVRAVGLIQ